MSNIFILSGAQPCHFALGSHYKAFAARAYVYLKSQGHGLRQTTVVSGYDVYAEVANHQKVGEMVLQSPVNWMGAPWSFNKYLDKVCTACQDGCLCESVGRSPKAPNVA